MVGVSTIGAAAAGEIRFAGVLPPEGTPTGKISVFSSRFFFGFGSGAVQGCQSPFIQSSKVIEENQNSPLSFSCT